MGVLRSRQKDRRVPFPPPFTWEESERRAFKLIRPSLLAVAIAAFATAATAHIVADPGRASAGAYQAVRFRVGHGCGDGATTALRIEIPQQMISARPQPKPGWTLEIERGEDGKVTAVTWRGNLPDEQFDEFALMFKLPDEAGTLYFPTVQSCGVEQNQWIAIPASGERPSHPAPSLTLVPKAATAEAHKH